MPSLSTARNSLLAAALIGSGAVARAQFNYTETFANDTAAGWNFYSGNTAPGPRLTSGAAPSSVDPEAGKAMIDNAGQGWLRLATTTSNQSNAAYFDAALPARGNDITVRFSVAMWGDKGEALGGDGLTFFMRDASQDFSVGAFGGSIGYAQKSGIDGVSGGYFGVALDVYGNYSNPTEGRAGGVGARPNAVVLRGPGDGQSGYDYLAGTSGYDYTDSGSPITRNSWDAAIAALPYSLSQATATARPDQNALYRNVEITLTSADQLTVRMQFGEDATWRNLFTADMSSFDRPEMMAFGFSSGTGGANQVYEIGNSFSVSATAAENTYFWDNGGSLPVWGDLGNSESNWVGNVLPPNNANIVFNDAYVSTAQAVVLQETRSVDSLYFSGAQRYELWGLNDVYPGANPRLIFDDKGSANTSHLSLTKSQSGNASHAINVDVQLNNRLVIENYLADQSLTFGDNVYTQGQNITLKGSGTTIFEGNLTGGGHFVKEGSGLLEFNGTTSLTSLSLDSGTLLLDSAHVSGTGALNITGDSVIDFGSTSPGSVLNFASLSIAAGVTLTITNWTNAIDFFFVNKFPGTAALGQIVFAGFGPAAWDSFTKQIRPVPEPSTYGLILGSLAVLGYIAHRWRENTRSRISGK